MFTNQLLGAADDHMALWVLGDSIVEGRERRVYEHWKSGLGVTFVLARPISPSLLTH